MTTLTDLDLLRAARALIADPERWTTVCFARNGSGNAVSIYAKTAKQWCAIGAVRKVAGRNRISDGDRAALRLRDLAQEQGISTVTAVNDGCGHRAVLSLYDEAIRRLEQGGAA